MDRTTDGFIEVADARLELRRIAGEGTPILLLHEALGSISLWRDFPERLASASGHPVVVWSRQGFGNSDPLPEPPGLDYLDRAANQVVALLDALEIGTAHLHGHSDGATIALITAALAPERVASLVLQAPHVTHAPTAAQAIRALRDAYPDGTLRRRLARHHRDPDRTFANWADPWLSPVFRDWSIEPLLAKVKAPTLLIHGMRDEYFGLKQLDRIEAGVPTAERLVLAECGHSPYRDRPDEVIAASVRFLQRAELAMPIREASR